MAQHEEAHTGKGAAAGSQTLIEELYGASLERASVDHLTLSEWLDAAERWRILRALRETGGNRSEAARRLGIGRRTLYSKMERLAIAPGRLR